MLENSEKDWSAYPSNGRLWLILEYDYGLESLQGTGPTLPRIRGVSRVLG